MTDTRVVPKQYRKKPLVIEAVQLRWDTWDEMCEFAGVGKLTDGKPEGCYGPDGESIALSIPTLEGVMTANENDWIIRGVKGELYPCKPDIFEASYEPAAPTMEPLKHGRYGLRQEQNTKLEQWEVEIDELKADIERHIKISTEAVTENTALKAKLENIQKLPDKWRRRGREAGICEVPLNECANELEALK